MKFRIKKTKQEVNVFPVPHPEKKGAILFREPTTGKLLAWEELEPIQVARADTDVAIGAAVALKISTAVSGSLD